MRWIWSLVAEEYGLRKIVTEYRFCNERFVRNITAWGSNQVVFLEKNKRALQKRSAHGICFPWAFALKQHQKRELWQNEIHLPKLS